MGQKINPIIFRIGPLNSWTSRWYASPSSYPKRLREDVDIRKFLNSKLRTAGIDRIMIERSRGAITITIHAAKPGMIIGRGGQGIEDVKKQLLSGCLKNAAGLRGPKDTRTMLNINIQEVSRPNLSAAVVREQVIAELERRMPYRRVLKQAMDRVMKAGALGVKIKVKGRLNGAEIARTETLSEGKIPLHTLRADINYSRGAARTTYGAIGVKVWIYRGDIFSKDSKDETKSAPRPRRPRPVRPPAK